MSQDADVNTPVEERRQHALCTLVPNQHHFVRYFGSILIIPYRRSSSLVLRKFKIGAKAVGSLSINICKWEDEEMLKDIVRVKKQIMQCMISPGNWFIWEEIELGICCSGCICPYTCILCTLIGFVAFVLGPTVSKSFWGACIIFQVGSVTE